MASSRRAIARAAFSIRASTGRPLAKSWFSSAAIWLPVTSRWSASAGGQVGTGEPLEGSGRGASRGMAGPFLGTGLKLDCGLMGRFALVQARSQALGLGCPSGSSGFRQAHRPPVAAGRGRSRAPWFCYAGLPGVWPPDGCQALGGSRGKGRTPTGPAQFHDGTNSRSACPRAAVPRLWPVFPLPPNPRRPVRPPRPLRPGRRRSSGCGPGLASSGWRWASRGGWIAP